MRGSCLSPEASLRLVKFVPDEFVTPLPPLSNSNYLGYKTICNVSLKGYFLLNSLYQVAGIIR
ncbi:hypothetical protein DET57_11671 [Klebsiella oxytoca]|uniref:Uncharacterized protein n=1 Tax=Klebsiella oxytoca TaxID=571 RepID=A0A318FMS9_KLEOX|nr:hypothetical protein DET57_11671 [Klebsiella oxytoca]